MNTCARTAACGGLGLLLALAVPAPAAAEDPHTMPAAGTRVRATTRDHGRIEGTLAWYDDSGVALARCGNESHRRGLVEALNRLDWDKLNRDRRLDLLRAYALVLIRLGEGSDELRQSILSRLDERFPSGDRQQDRELAQLLVALRAPGIAGRILKELAEARTQEELVAAIEAALKKQ